MKIKDKEGKINEVDFTTPWKRVNYIEQVQNDSGIDISQYTTGDDEKLRNDIKAK